MATKEKPGGAGQQESTTRYFTTSDKPTGETEPSLEQQARQRAQARRKAGNGEVPPTPATTEPSGLNFEQIPADLKALPQWVCWRIEERAGDTTKVPYNAESGRRARSNDLTTWATFDTAVEAYLRGGYAGVGFMFWEGDGLTGLDLDHVIDLETGEIDPRALEILDRFQGTYCEISPSGTGFRIFTRGSPGRSGKNEGRGKWLEVYTHPSHRYLTVTGHHWPQAAVEVTAQQDALDWLHEKYFTKPDKPKPATKPTTTPNLGIDDSELLDKARAAANGYQFGQLWNGDTTGHRGDHSSADLALCSLLAFWTGKDADRMDRLFRQSGLMRPKWDSRRGDTTYGQITIDKAIAECSEVYTEGGKGKGGNGEYHGQCADTADAGYWESIGQDAPSAKPDDGVPLAGTAALPNAGKIDIRTRLGIRSLEAIRATEYATPRYAIPGIVPEGLTLLAGPPKVKKSWFALAAAIAVGLGGKVLGRIDVTQGRVLYLALEDRERRLQSRANSILVNGEGKLDNLDMATKWRRLDRGGLEDLREYLTAYPDTNFVIVDTLAMVRQRKLRNQSDYDADYDATAMLKRVADDFSTCILVITHTRKQDAEDFLDAVIGTHGVSGAADGVIVLKRARCSDLATLSITGRDIEEEREIVIEWDQATCTWHMTEGDPAYVKLSPERKRIVDILRDASTPLSSKQIATAAHGREMGDKNDKAWKAVRTLLGVMVLAHDITQLPTKAYTLEGSNNE